MQEFNMSNDMVRNEQELNVDNVRDIVDVYLEASNRLTQAKIDQERQFRDAAIQMQSEVLQKYSKEGKFITQQDFELRRAEIERTHDKELEDLQEKLQKEIEALSQSSKEKDKQRARQLQADLEEIQKVGAADAVVGDKKLKKNLARIKKETEEQTKANNKLAKDSEKLAGQAQKRAEKAQAKAQEKQKREAAKSAGEAKIKAGTAALSQPGLTVKERFEALKEASTDGKGRFNPLQLAGVLTNAISDFAKQLDSQVESIARKQSSINTRLQGSDKTWQQMNKTFNKVAGASPLIKQEDLVTNLESMVEAGINYNVEQRAFLATISKKIATTFNAADATMLKLIRLQQKDSTAARLGMESAMTAFLNNMYENTEYLKGVAEGVRSQLAEAESLMTDQGAVEFEFQMQKWLGSLYSVGMSQQAVNNIAGAVGKLAAGDISGITGGGTSNLLMMAANQSGISITDALTKGLDASQTNKLMKSMVEYLAGLYNSSKDSKVLQQQFANVYGVSASDLRAALNLANDNNKTLQAITGNNLTYTGAMGQLMNMAGTMHERTSMGEMLENAFGNLKYTMSSGIANNPALYATYKIAGMLDDVVGGIQLPFINTFFGGVDLHTSVADIMRTAALSGSILSGMGGIINSLSGGPSGWGTNMLKTMGVGSNVTSVKRGSGAGLATSGVTVSESGYAGNASGDDVQNKSLTEANEEKQEAQAAEEDNSGNEMMDHVRNIDATVLELRSIFNEVTNGTRKFHVITATEGLAWSESTP